MVKFIYFFIFVVILALFSYATEGLDEQLTGQQVFIKDISDNFRVSQLSESKPKLSPTIHASYYAEGLRYARWNEISSVWDVTIVDSVIKIEDHTSIAVDDTGVPHVAYYGGIPPDVNLLYATYVGSSGNCGYDKLTGSHVGDWQCHIVDYGVEGINGTTNNSNDVGYNPSIIISNGVPKISYYDANNENLKYASYVGSGGNCGYDKLTGSHVGDWQCDAIGSFGSSDGSDSDQSDAGVSYSLVGWPSMLMFATHVGSSGNCGYDGLTRSFVGDWQCDLVDNFTRTSLRFFGSATNHFSEYYGVSSAPFIGYLVNDDSVHQTVLQFAEYVGSGGNCGTNNDWQCERGIDRTASIPYPQVDVATEIDDKPYIMYVAGNGLTSTSADIKIAVLVGSGGNCGTNNNWQCDIIDSNDIPYWRTGGAITFGKDDGKIYVAYADDEYAGNVFKIAKYVGSGGNCGYDGLTRSFVGNWQCDLVDKTSIYGGGGFGSDIAYG
ncbi:MAG: hypothetical protein Q8Q42_03820 [Nanoarchaeota archaeon]|nr:hypothetical protein [Nanoarchaeota archaeon]